MDLIGDIAAIRNPLPQPGDVTPEDLYPDAYDQAAAEREEYKVALQAQCDDLEEDALLLAIGNARAAKEAADREIRLLLAYGREFHGERPYKLEPLAQASGYTVSGIRTAYADQDVAMVTRGIERRPNSRRYQAQEDTDRP
ncbi:hypothetical protein ABZ864_47865 [Streptomyces sp. NPDC047082]|uniref:hypothetical protein n=1 Tax=Streptomyces sp. NPDC047082 TaxID=3155259 RepID=UPI0033DE1B6A